MAATVGVAAAALPYLSRWVQLSVETAIGVLAVVAVVNSSGLPAAVVAGLAVGWGAAALIHLIVGSPLGLPSGDEVRLLLADLDIDAEGIAPTAGQVWGVGCFTGRVDRSQVDVSVYGRDASDARVPAVLAAGPAGPAHDALLVTRPPGGTHLSDFAPYVPPVEHGADDAEGDAGPAGPAEEPAADRPSGPTITDATLDDVFGQLMTLREARIAHGALSIRTIVVDDHGSTGFVDFRVASTVATDDQLNRDLAAAMAATAEVAGPERVIASAIRSLPTTVLVGALPFLQRAALDSAASRALKGKKASLTALREQGAAAAGVEVPKLIEPRRVSWVNLVLVAGTIIGGWALIGVLVNVTKSWSTITGAKWGWVALVFVLAQAAYPAIAITTVGSVTNPLPFGRTLALELSDTFVALAGGSMAVLATHDE